MRFDLGSVAPRLALAHRERRAELAAERAARRHARNAVLRWEWIVAHRELQLVRAGATGDGRYIDRRRHKLAVAEKRLRSARQRAKRLNA